MERRQRSFPPLPRTEEEATVLSDLAKQRYVKHPNACPLCGHAEITAHQAEFDADYAWRSITCDGCDAEWHDVYELCGIELVVEPA